MHCNTNGTRRPFVTLTQISHIPLLVSRYCNKEVRLPMGLHDRDAFSCRVTSFCIDLELGQLIQSSDWATVWTTEALWFNSLQKQESFLCPRQPRPAPVPNLPTIQCQPRFISLGLKRPESESNHLLLSNAAINPLTLCLRYVHRDSFIPCRDSS